jgi:hypothetical protein
MVIGGTSQGPGLCMAEHSNLVPTLLSRFTVLRLPSEDLGVSVILSLRVIEVISGLERPMKHC